MSQNIVSLLVILSLGGCSSVADPSSAAPSSTSTPLQGGSLDTGDPAVGILYASTSPTYLCSGTLIAPHIVMTAAHCVNNPVGPLDTFYTGNGTPMTTQNPAFDPALTAHQIIDQQADPAFVNNCPNQHDVALVRISDPVHPGLIRLATTSAAEPLVGSSVTAVGYGIYTSSGFTTIESKRSGTETVFSWPDSYNLLLSFGNSIADSGDSGGPIFYNNTLVGVTSCHLDGTWPGHQKEYYARVDVSSPFITATMTNWIAQCHTQCTNDIGPCAPGDCFCLADEYNCYRWGCGENYPVISCFGGF